MEKEKSIKTESSAKQKKATSKKNEQTKKVVAKSVPVQKKTVTKKSDSVKKTATKEEKIKKEPVKKSATKEEKIKKEPVKKDATKEKSKKDNLNKESVKKSVTKKTANKEKTKKEPVNKSSAKEEVNKKIKEQEELIAHVESVSEQAKIYEDLLEHNLLDENEEVSEELIDPKVFKKNELETIKKELKNNKKLNKSKNKKQEKYKEIFKNSLIFIFVELYFLILLISKSTIGTIEYITDLKVFILTELVVSIVLFEISYKKDNSKIAWHGIEMILLGATTILILDLYSRQSSIINTVFAIIAGAFIVYYIIKMFIIAFKKQKLENI